MLSLLLLVIKILSVIFAPSSFDPVIMSDVNRTHSGSRNPVLDTNESATRDTESSATAAPFRPQPPQRLVSSELTSFTSSSSKQRLERNESVAGSVLHGTFPCVWQNYNGTLVTGDRAVVFTGSFFLFEKTLILPWDDIRRVELVDNANIDLATRVSSINGIIEIIVNDEAVHSFFNVRSPEKVWLLLLTLHNDALLGRKASSSTSLPHTPRLQRRNSDPALSGSLLASSEHDETTIVPPPSHPYRPVVSITTSMAESVTQATIESATGRLKLQPIQCVYIGVTGRLFAGQTAVYFTGKRYFWEHVSVTLPWSSIRHIVSNTQTSDANGESSNVAPSWHGIVITTKESAVRTDGGSADEDETTFEFRNVDTPDKVWAKLIALQNESLRSVPLPSPILEGSSALSVEATPDVSNRRKSMRRTNSDPRTGSQVNFRYDEQEASKLAYSPIKPEVLIPDVSSAQTTQEEPRIETSAGDAWRAVSTSDDRKTYDNVVIDHHVLQHCNLDQFFDLFVSDNAQYSLGRFLEARGDFDLHSTDWQAGNGAASAVPTHTRVVQYMHPVNVPLAPPQARARKEQRVSRFGAYGILLSTETYVDDVPMTDCFYVADRIRVEPSSDNANNIIITLEFGITFVKSTMFKGIISRKTTSEFTVLFKAMTQYMTDALAGAVGNTKSDSTTPETSDKAVPEKADHDSAREAKSEAKTQAATQALSNSKPSSTLDQLLAAFSRPDRILLVVVLVLQVWLLFEIRSVKQSLAFPSREYASNDHCGATE